MKKTWIINGDIKVRHELQEVKDAFTETGPLGGILVQVSAKQKALGVWSPWNSWANVITDSSGHFEVKNEKSDNKRRFKIEVKFKSDELKIFGAHSALLRTVLGSLLALLTNAQLTGIIFIQILKLVSRILYKTEWHKIYEEGDNIEHNHGTVNLPVAGELIFEAGGKHSLGEDEPRKHAQIWFIYSKTFKFLKDLGQEIPYTRPVAIKYPHHNPLFDLNLPIGNITISNVIEASYTDPANQIIYLIENSDHSEFRLDIMIHELMHIWMFRRTRGELTLAWQNTVHGGVHNLPEEHSYVSFHEGFAEWSSNQAQRQLFKVERPTVYEKFDDVGLPFSRKGLRDNELTSLAEADRNEFAWISLFNMMVTNNLHKFDFNGALGFVEDNFTPNPLQACSSPFIITRDVLRVVSANPDRGIDENITKDEMTIDGFLNRALALIPSLTEAHTGLYKRLLDPNDTVNPHDILCHKNIVIP